MLYRVSKSCSDNREVFPKVIEWGSWFIEYDDDINETLAMSCAQPKDHPDLIKHRKFIHTDGDTLTFKGGSYVSYLPCYKENPIEFNNYTYKLYEFSLLHVDTLIHLNKNGQYTTSLIPELYKAPYTDSDLSMDDVATSVKDILVKRLTGFCEQYQDGVLVTSGGMDTGVLEALIVSENLPIKIDNKYNGQLWPIIDGYHNAGPQQKFCANTIRDFRQLPTDHKIQIGANSADGQMIAQPKSARLLCKYLDIDYEASVHHALKKGMYNTHHQLNPLSGVSHHNQVLDDHDVTNLLDAKWRVDDNLSYNGSIFNIDGRVLWSGFKARDIQWWIMGLKPELFILQHHDKTVYKTIIQMTTPKLLDSINKRKVPPKLDRYAKMRIPKRWSQDERIHHS